MMNLKVGLTDPICFMIPEFAKNNFTIHLLLEIILLFLLLLRGILFASGPKSKISLVQLI